MYYLLFISPDQPDLFIHGLTYAQCNGLTDYVTETLPLIRNQFWFCMPDNGANT